MVLCDGDLKNGISRESNGMRQCFEGEVLMDG